VKSIMWHEDDKEFFFPPPLFVTLIMPIYNIIDSKLWMFYVKIRWYKLDLFMHSTLA
jgi:hypothetical protein